MSRAGLDPRVQDVTLPVLGTMLRIAVIAEDRAPGAELTAQLAQFMQAADLALSRFLPHSELRLLEARSGGEPVPVSRLLATALTHAASAARQTGGLIDPMLGRAMEQAGYEADWDPGRRLPLDEVLRAAPRRRPAAPAQDARWRGLWVDQATRRVRVPKDARLDVGATAKGLLADLALRLVGPAELAIIDLGGDLAINGRQLADTPTPVLAADPFDRDPVRLHLHAAGGVATSSIAGRCWATSDGPAHHLLDPSTGRPAFTGLVQVTAAAPSAAQAEVLAGHALLAGPDAAPALLAPHGGVLTHDDGTIQTISGTLITEEDA